MDLLADEGLVDIVPNKGAFVVNPTEDEVLQAYVLRKDLEIMAAGLAMERLTEADFLEMSNSVAEEREALFNKDLSTYLKANQSFHMIFVRKCGNKFLIEFIEKLINQTSIYLMLFDIFFEDSSPKPYGYKEHLEIIALFKQQNLNELEMCLTKHFDHAVGSLDVRNEYKELGSIFGG
uniref:GntR C-terminal domain-containing protein n=2 Tax=Virgibacillus oceani TaxID=1479511 RepID=A0A917M5A6_9BACI|nr:hypothetical protein GCM10011398_26430 [Virgibacillus oceani]